jgi:glutaredoxin|tara:strand:+ start:1247 stop:1621 length:375 start_codon:yes stop_codon:yes gene_type:complete
MTNEVPFYKNPWIYGLVIIAVLIVIVSIPKGPGEYDVFAKCLTERGAVMYGTDTCPHCKNQKELFGNSFKKINYINCDFKMEECLRNRVEGYPTWIIDGGNYPGEQPLEKLSVLSGCELVRDIS